MKKSSVTIKGGILISSHKRLKGRKNQYSTMPEHMPKSHQYSEWNGKRFKSWASSIGPYMFEIITMMLASRKVEEQAYKGCHSVLNMSKKYGKERLEAACSLVFGSTTRPSYRYIHDILDKNLDLKEKRKKEVSMASKKNDIEADDAFIRGEDYYG